MSLRIPLWIKWILLSVGFTALLLVIATLLINGLPKTWQDSLRLVGAALGAAIAVLAGLGEFATWVRSLLNEKAQVSPEQLGTWFKEAKQCHLIGALGQALDLLKKIEAVDPHFPGLTVEMAAVKRELARGYTDDAGRVMPYQVMNWARARVREHQDKIALLLIIVTVLVLLSIHSVRETCATLARALMELLSN